jgi:hypothetical protein
MTDTAEDPGKVWGKQVRESMNRYLSQHRRDQRISITLNEDEENLLIRAAKQEKIPKATMARIGMMFGLTAFLDS